MNRQRREWNNNNNNDKEDINGMDQYESLMEGEGREIDKERRRIFSSFSSFEQENRTFLNQHSTLDGILFGLRILFGLSFTPLFSIFVVIITKSSIHLFFLLNRNNLQRLEENHSHSFFSNLFWVIQFGVQLFIFGVLCFFLNQLLSNVTVFWFDFFSKDEHPRLRRAIQKLNLGSIFPSYSFVSSTQIGIFVIMVFIPFVTKLFFNGSVIKSTRREDMQFANSMINGVIILLEIALLIVLLSLERMQKNRLLRLLMLPILKGLFLVGSFLIALLSSDDSALIISGARTIIVFCFLFTVLVIGWLLLNAIANIKEQYIIQFQHRKITLMILLGISFLIVISLIFKRPIAVLFFLSTWMIVFKYGSTRKSPTESTSDSAEIERATKKKRVDHIIFLLTSFFYVFFFLIIVILLGTFFQETKGVTSNSCSMSFTSASVSSSPSISSLSRNNRLNSISSEEMNFGYPICGNRWYGMDIVDFSMMSYLAYWKGEHVDDEGSCMKDRFKREFHEMFGKEDWIERNEQSATSVAFYDLYSEKKNLSVISIRGTTSRFLDVLQDVDLYADIGLFQFISLFVPVMTVLPDTLIADLIRIAAMPEQILGPSEHHYYEPVTQYVSNIKDRNVIIVGHSLGGAIAQIVGSKMNHTTFAFSSPGIVYSRRKVGISLGNIEKYTINVIPFKDPITKIDKHGGLIQQIMCTEKNPADCHKITLTMCELWRKCRGEEGIPSIVCKPNLEKQV